MPIYISRLVRLGKYLDKQETNSSKIQGIRDYLSLSVILQGIKEKLVSWIFFLQQHTVKFYQS